jgi:hypothetical protein
MIKRLLVIVLPLVLSCHRYVYNDSGDCAGSISPYVSVNIVKVFTDPVDTTKVITDYKLVKGWAWEQVKIWHDTGYYFLSTQLDAGPGLRIKWKADTLAAWTSTYLSNDTSAFPGALYGAVSLVDSVGKPIAILRQSYSLPTVFYKINRCPDVYTEIFIHQVIDSGKYKGYELKIDIQGPANSFK